MKTKKEKQDFDVLQEAGILIDALLEIEKDIEADCKQLNQFNLLCFFSDIHEAPHSDVIAEILNPKGEHCCDAQFLNLFIERVFDRLKNKEKIDKYTLASDDIVEITREFPLVNKNIDIIITFKKKSNTYNKYDLIIGIANKILSNEEENQASDYYKSIKDIPADKRILLYLNLTEDKVASIMGDNQTDNQMIYLPVSYKRFIIPWLEKCIQSIENEPDKNKVKVNLENYLGVVKRFYTMYIMKKLLPGKFDKLVEKFLLNSDYQKSIRKSGFELFKSLTVSPYGKFSNFANHQETATKVADMFFKKIQLYQKIGLKKSSLNENNKPIIKGNKIIINNGQIEIDVGNELLTITHNDKAIKMTCQGLNWEEIYYYTFDLYNAAERNKLKKEKIEKLLRDIEKIGKN